MVQDKKDIIEGLDRIATDARVSKTMKKRNKVSFWLTLTQAAKSFTPSEAVAVLDSARSLDKEIIQLSNEVIINKNSLPTLLHSAIAVDLQTFGVHAKGAGDALINDFPVRL